MSGPLFCELLARSAFSFLRGASQPEEMIDRAKELGLPALALCDRDGLYGVVRAYAQAKERNVRVIVGAELSLAEPSRPVLRTGSWSTSRRAKVLPETPTVALLAEDHDGYTNLCRLLTSAHHGLPKGESLLELERLGESSAGLVAVVPFSAVPGSAEAPTRALLQTVTEVFGPERAFLGACLRLDGEDHARLASVLEASERYGLSVLATNHPLFHEKERKALADVLHCIRHGTTLDEAGAALSANAEAVLRSDTEMRRLFREREEWVDAAGLVAERLRFSLSEIRYDFPCTLAPGETADEALRRCVEEGSRRRYPNGVPSHVATQMEKELRLIAELEVAPYFLSTREIVEIAREKRILCQGRGSAANSAVCYVLGITAVDPSRANLLFERFLSAERREPPDIDIDFEHERREEVIQEIYARYGRDRAAMVSEVISYRGKSALREVGKAFGLSLEQVGRLAGTLSHWDSVEDGEKRATELGLDLEDARLRKVLDVARELEGFPRHLSVHVGGFVLSARPLVEVSPVEPARREDRTVLPWDKDDIETLGFFKVDVLGLGMLTAIRKCLELLHRPEDPPFDPLEAFARIPAEDPAVYAMASEADTVGVFQIESRAQMAMLPRLRPQKFYDLVIEVAIVRPGPIQGGMVHPYLRRRNGEEPILAPHPSLVPILERTLGVPLFQEQVMQIAIVGAGYTGGEADQLRRDMAAWKKSGKLLRHRDRLISGFLERGISREFGEALFEQIKGFGEYGFPESHAASFALLVYASAWEKAHYPAHFTCALLNAQPMGFYSPSSLVKDAQKHGVEARDACVVRSTWDSTLEAPSKESRIESRAPGANRALRLGLRLVRGLGEGTANAIVAARAERPFSSLEDLKRRAGVGKKEMEALAEAGAFEELCQGRRQALWKTRAPETGGLFAALDAREPEVRLPELRGPEQLLLDYARKGLSVHDHPMCHLRERLAKRRVVPARDLESVPQGRVVNVAGLVLTRQRPGTASGVVFITLEDETGIMNLVLWSRVFEEHYLAARHATLLLATGKVERQVTEPRPTEVGRATPIVHVIVDRLERLDVPGIESRSRDFH
ncbi:MAG TPA: error-prone DNA polymerase [Polyangiaceae bacterium]|nr:error-prone DNA polymerase [Polyangiaceae bacterium]